MHCIRAETALSKQVGLGIKTQLLTREMICHGAVGAQARAHLECLLELLLQCRHTGLAVGALALQVALHAP